MTLAPELSHPSTPNGPLRHRRRWQLRLRRMVAFTTLTVLVLGMLASLSGWLYMRPASKTLDQELTLRVSELVGPGKPIKNAALEVATGDGAFEWAGAAGIARQDGLVPMTTDTPVYVASVTKLFTATTIIRLYEQGALSLDDPVAKYLPEDLIRGIDVYQGHDYSNEITIAQLLSHTSGLPDYYEDKASDGKSLFELLVADPERAWTVDDTIARARDQMEPHFVPGTAGYYSDTNFQLLGKIIEAVTGKPLDVVFDEYVFRPAGLTHTWLVGRSQPEVAPTAAVAEVFYNGANITSARANPAFWADGGIVSTTGDLIRFLKALNSGAIVRKDTLQRMHNWRPLENLPFQYGYGTMYFALPAPVNAVLGTRPIWGHMGTVGAFAFYAEDLDLYMAGTIDEVGDNQTTLLLLQRVLAADQQLR